LKPIPISPLAVIGFVFNLTFFYSSGTLAGLIGTTTGGFFTKSSMRLFSSSAGILGGSFGFSAGAKISTRPLAMFATFLTTYFFGSGKASSFTTLTLIGISKVTGLKVF
jgi:hypothetical protein